MADRYEGLKPEIADKLKRYENVYFIWDKPVPFCDTLSVYPVTMTDYEMFLFCSSCFTLNRKDDPVGLTKSNLGYLFYKMQLPRNENNPEEDGPTWSYKFQKLCEIIFHIQNGLKCKECGQVVSYQSPEFAKFLADTQTFVQNMREEEITNDTDSPKLVCSKCQKTDFIEMVKIVVDPKTKKEVLFVDGQCITSQDFDLLRQLVLYQNFPKYSDDSWVDKKLREDHEERQKLLQKTQGNVHASLEKKMVSLSIATSYSLEQIYQMSMRKFTMALESIDDLINYKIMKTAAMSGFVKLEKGQTIEHWIYKKETGEYDHYQDLESVKAEVKSL